MSEHTKGPLSVQNKGNIYGRSARVEVVEGVVGNEKPLPKRLPTVARMKDLSDSSYANAHLFAAAPELLDALENCADLLEHMHEQLGPHRCTVGCPDIGKRVDRARVAITKAKGD